MFFVWLDGSIRPDKAPTSYFHVELSKFQRFKILEALLRNKAEKMDRRSFESNLRPNMFSNSFQNQLRRVVDLLFLGILSRTTIQQPVDRPYTLAGNFPQQQVRLLASSWARAARHGTGFIVWKREGSG